MGDTIATSIPLTVWYTLTPPCPSCSIYSAGQLNMVNFLVPELRGFQKNRVWNCAQMG